MEPTRSINGHSNGRRTDEIELLINPESQDGRQASHHQASRSGAHAPAGAHGATDGAKCGVYKTLANIFISFMGAGILGLPYAFRHAGLALGAAFMLFLSLLAFYAILLLVDCKKALEHRGVRTYSEVAEAALGRWGRVLVETMLVLSQTGFCVAYVIFIYKNLPLLPGGKYGITLAVLPFQAMLAMLRDLSALAPFSLLADAATVVGMLVVLADDVDNLWTSSSHDFVGSKGATALPFPFGVVIYCYEGIGMILPIEDAMRDKSKFRGTLTVGFGTITAIFLIFGAVGYAAFGEGTHDVITQNLPTGWSTFAVKLALCCALFFTFPVMMVPVYEILENALDASPWVEHNVSPRRRWFLFKLVRIVVVAATGFVAVSVPGFSLFIAFVGCFCCASLAFIIPAACHLVLYAGALSLPRRAMNYFLMLFGFVGMVFGVAQVVRDVASGKHSVHAG